MAQRTQRLMPFGLRANERSVLFSMCSLSGHSSRDYLYELTAEPAEADIYIVDGDDPEAVASWRAAEQVRRRPAILIVAEPPAHATAWTLRRPLLAPRLMSAVDNITRIARSVEGRPGTLRPRTLNGAPVTVARALDVPTGAPESAAPLEPITQTTGAR